MTADRTDRLLAAWKEAGYGVLSREELARAASDSSVSVDRLLEGLWQRGYRFRRTSQGDAEPVRPEPLEAARIEEGLDTCRIGQCVICFDTVESTNTVAWGSARQGNTDGLVITAECQSAGRGRLGRNWVSPRGLNLLFSVVLSDAQDRLAHEALTISTGLAVAEGIEQSTGVECDLKWPNDVLIEGAKVAGVLVETGRVARRRWCVIGIGINVGWSPEAESVRRPATCLYSHAKAPCDRTQILQAVLSRLDLWVNRVEARALDLLRKAWLSRCGMLHRRLRLRGGNQDYEGIVLDINPLEGLVLAPDQGPRVLIPSSSATLLD